MNKLIQLSTFLLLTSCAVQVPVYKGVFNSPNVNDITKKGIGESIYINEDIQYKDAIQITKILSDNIFKGDFTYKVGDIVPFGYENKKYLFYHYKNEFELNGTVKVFSKESVKFGDFGVAVSKENPSLAYPIFTTNGTMPSVDTSKNIEYVKTRFLTPDCGTCFKGEIIYNGRVNNNLKFIYREFVRDMARPAFTQELQYDLNESNIIGFKNMRIEIIKASNTEIEYKLLSTL